MILKEIFELEKQDHGKTLVKLLISYGLIAEEGSVKCSICNKATVLDHKGSNQFRWRCYHRRNGQHCRYSVSVRKGTFFEQSHLTFGQVCSIVSLWLDGASNLCIQHQVNISKRTVVKWVNYCREVMHDDVVVKKVPIGGPGLHVEIDESKFAKRKYNRGRRVEGQWVFGGVERESGKCFMIPVEKRNRTTLFRAITEWIKPGSIIISDCWRAYKGLDKLGYTHITVNHQIGFVNPDNGACTNRIEGLWYGAKRSFLNSGRRKIYFDGYLAKFVFMHRCRIDNIDPFTEFFKAASNLYNPTTLNDEELGIQKLFNDAELERNFMMKYCPLPNEIYDGETEDELGMSVQEDEIEYQESLIEDSESSESVD